MKPKSNKNNDYEEETDENFLNQKRRRGRPKKDPKENLKKAKNEFISFLNNSIRAKEEKEEIGLQEIKTEIEKIISDTSKEKDKGKEFEEVFKNLRKQNINEYFIIKNWDVEEKKVLDQILVKFLKELSFKVNKTYFFLHLN